MTYRIEQRNEWDQWTPEGLGDVCENTFATKEDAEQMSEYLRKIGPDWADADLRVVEVD